MKGNKMDHRLVNDVLEDLRNALDPRTPWQRFWEAAKATVGFAMIIAFVWGLYVQVPESRDIIKTVAPWIIGFFAFGLLSMGLRKLRRLFQSMD
jgi:hypothetical protein